jgi:hypothetical protein
MFIYLFFPSNEFKPYSNNDSYTSSNEADDLNRSVETSTDKFNNPNVLKRIYALKYLQRSTDINSLSSREFWMPDDQVKECFECNDKFTTFRRRHVAEFLILAFRYSNRLLIDSILCHLALSRLRSNILPQVLGPRNTRPAYTAK